MNIDIFSRVFLKLWLGGQRMQIEKRRMETLNTKGGTTGKVFGMIDMIYLVIQQHRVWNWILTVIIVITVIIYDASSSSESIKKIINSKSSFWSGQPSNITRRQWSWVHSAQSITTTGGGWIHIVLTYQLWIIWLTGVFYPYPNNVLRSQVFLTFHLLSAACHILLGQPKEAMAEARLATQLEVGNGI